MDYLRRPIVLPPRHDLSSPLAAPWILKLESPTNMDLIIQHNRLSKAEYHIPLPSNPQQSPKAHLVTQNIYRKLTSPSTALHQIHPPTQSHSRPIYPAKVEMGSYGKITRMLTDDDEPEIYVTPDNNREGDQMHCLGDRDALRANDLGAKKDDRVKFDVAANGKLCTNVQMIRGSS